MYCRRCGNQVNAADNACSNCGEMLRLPVQQYVPNYIIWSILSTLFCCLPFGIVAIIFSARVNTMLANGNLALAHRASINARNWCWISFATGIAFQILSVMWAIRLIMKMLQSHSMYV